MIERMSGPAESFRPFLCILLASRLLCTSFFFLFSNSSLCHGVHVAGKGKRRGGGKGLNKRKGHSEFYFFFYIFFF